MRSRIRPRKHRLLACALGLALIFGIGTAADARAEISLPPPAIDQWPSDPARECASTAQRDHGDFRGFCQFWHACETDSGLSARERDWCAVRSSALELRQRCYGANVPFGSTLTARKDASAPACRNLLESRWKRVCIESPVRAETSRWSCRQTQAISLTDWEEAWRKNDCMELLDAPGRVEEAPERGVEFCGYYGHDRYRQLCRGSGVEEGTLPTRPTDRDQFCLLWDSSALNPNGGCQANPDSPQGQGCRDFNEERWRELGCSARNLDYGEEQFCWKYGWQRYDDFCRRDTSANPDPTHPPSYRTPAGEQRPEGIDDFCREWESGPWAEGEPPSDISGFAGETPPGAEDQEDPLIGAPDVFAELGAQSPFCNYPDRLTASARRACQLSGSIAHQYPIAHYGLDYQGDDGEASLTDVDLAGIATGMLQTVLNLVWIGVVYLLKGILLLLEWAFEVPIIGGCGSGGAPTATGACEDQFSEIPGALLELHEQLRPWLVVAFAVAGLWGLWNGLVRQRVSETFAGLLGTVVLMGVALAIVNNPVGTVGWVARVANDASLGVLNAATRAGSDNPTGSFADAQEGLFDTLVTRPWCALQFGDVAWCTQRDERSGLAPADVWLAFAAGEQRVGLYKYMKGEEVENTFWNKLGDTWAYTWRFGCIFDSDFATGGPTACTEIEGNSDRRDEMIERQEALEAAMGEAMGGEGDAAGKVALQEKEGTPTRAPLLFLIVITQVGAILVLAWIGVRLFMAAVAVLVLLLFAPAMMLAPGFGEAGRNAFGGWLKRLGAAALAKLVFAIVLTIVLLVAGILAGLGLGWFPDWLLQSGFWWGLLLKRQQLASLANFDLQGATSPQGGGRGLLGGAIGGYLGYWAMSGGARSLLRAPGAPARAMRASRLVRREAEDKALRSAYGRRLGERASEAVRQRRTAIGNNLRRVRAQREANQARLDRARQQEQRAPRGMRDRLRALEDKRRGLEKIREQKKQEAEGAASRLAQLDARRAGLQRRGRGRELVELDSERARMAAGMERSRDEAQAAEERLERLAPHLQRTRDQVANYEPRRSPDAPQTPEARGKRREVERLEQEDDRLRVEEQRLVGEQARVRSELPGVPESDSEVGAAQQRGWWEQRRMAIDLGADPGGRAQLEAAGMDWDEYVNATPEDREAMRARSQHAMDADRELLDRSDTDSPSHFTPDARSLRDDPRYQDDRARYEGEERRKARDERRRRRDQRW